MRRQRDSVVDGERLKKWAIDELRVPGLSAHDDLSYICRGEMCNVWQHLVNNVTNRDTAKLVRDNIQLQRQTAKLARAGSGDGISHTRLEDKMKRYNLLAQQLNKQRIELSHLEGSIRLDQAELNTQSTVLRKSTTSQRDTATKVHLLSQHQDVLSRHKLVLERFQNSLLEFIDKHDVGQQKEVDVGMLHSNLDTSGRNVTLVELRKLHKSVADFLMLLLQGTVAKASLQEQKAKIKSSLSQLMSTAGSATVLNYIIHDINRTTARIEQETAAIDHATDVQRLGFQVVEEGLVDESSEPSLLSGLSELIEQRQLEHQERFLDTERYRTESVMLRNKIGELRESLYSRLSSMAGRGSNCALIREIIDKGVCEKQAEAALTVVNSLKAKLQHEVKSSSEQVTVLRRKHAAIASFRSDVQSKQNQICVLMKQNVSSRDKLDNRQALMGTTVDSLRGNAEPLQLLSSTAVTANYSSEMRQLRGLPLHSLSENPHTVLRGLHEASGEGSSHLQCLAQHLGFKHFLANDALLRTIFEKKIEILESYTRAPVISNSDDVKLAEDVHGRLLPQARQQVEQLLRDLVPKLQGSKDTIGRAQAKCDKVHSLIDEWWNQPAFRLQLTM